jgi:hypothetical protein
MAAAALRFERLLVEQWTVSPNSPLLPSYGCLVLPMVAFSCLVLAATAYCVASMPQLCATLC